MHAYRCTTDAGARWFHIGHMPERTKRRGVAPNYRLPSVAEDDEG
jgi:hypothetical protein